MNLGEDGQKCCNYRKQWKILLVDNYRMQDGEWK